MGLYKEICYDIFDVPIDWGIAHCISADFALGAGIAKEIDIRYHTRDQLISMYRNFDTDIFRNIGGTCLRTDRVFNLVTKERYWMKPTYSSLESSLCTMKTMLEYGCKRFDTIAMPKIGCGLDKLSWNKVSLMIQEIFNDSRVDIYICIK